MAPSDSSRRRTTTKSSTCATMATKAKGTRPRTRAQYKKQKQLQQQVKQPNIMEEYLLPSTSSTTLLDDHDGTSSTSSKSSSSSNSSSSNSTSSGCSTPKAQRFRLPEIVTCPPAPKKQRVVSNCSSSLQINPSSSRPIAFFAPPDLELFFFFALRDISV